MHLKPHKRRAQLYPQPPLIDAAGAFRGGAARLLRELDTYLLSTARVEPTIIGRDRHLTPGWLGLRNARVAPNQRTIALNNAPFFRGAPKVVLARNVLHFASEDELRQLNFKVSRELRSQIPVVRTMLRLADIIVCPCTAMADRVSRLIPSVAGRLVVRLHPLSPIRSATDMSRVSSSVPDDPFILVPIVNSAYKHLNAHVELLIAALDMLSLPHKVVITGTASEYGARVIESHRSQFLGVVPSSALDAYWLRSSMVYYPMSMEAYGYPVAEARANGVAVLAADTEQNREIGGAALSPFKPGDKATLVEAIGHAIDAQPEADPDPFDPVSYFEWLLHDQDESAF